MAVAAQTGNLHVVGQLIAAGAHLDVAQTPDIITPLFIAAQQGHLDVVGRLVDAGADIEKANFLFATPLAIALAQGGAEGCSVAG